mgnify:CR=1 FL=1
MEKFILNITASSGEFYQGSCESMVLPVKDGVYGVQAGHSPVLVAIHMGMLKFTVDGETREILVGDGIAEVTKEEARYLAGLIDIAEVSDAQLVGDLKRTPSAHNRDTDVLLSLDPRRDKANFV